MPSAPQNTQKPRKSRFGGLVLGPPHDEPFRATRQYSTTRGEAPFQRGGLAQIFRARHMSRKATYQAGLQQCRGGFYLRGSHSLKVAEEGKAGLLRAPGRERPSRALEKGKKGLSTPSEVPSVTRVGGRGSLKGRGVSAPFPPLQGKSGSREAFLAPWKGLLRAPWLSERPSSPQGPGKGEKGAVRAPWPCRTCVTRPKRHPCEGGKWLQRGLLDSLKGGTRGLEPQALQNQGFQYPSPRGMFKSPR